MPTRETTHSTFVHSSLTGELLLSKGMFLTLRWHCC